MSTRRFRMLKSISSRMIAATITLVVICSGSFLLLNMNEHETIYKRTVFNHLEALASNFSDDLVPLLSDPSNTLEMSTKLLDFEEYTNVKYAIIYDSQWRVLEQHISTRFMSTLDSQAQLPPFNIGTLDIGVSIRDGDLIALNSIGDKAYLQGYLLIVNDFRVPLNASNYTLFISSLPIALIILLVMIMISVIFNRRLLAPLSRLAKFTESIETSSNYHLRYQGEGDDEVSDLGKNINAMLSRIQHQNSLTVKHTLELEENKQALEKLANYDPLTNLPNRKLFIESLSLEIAKVKRRSSNLMVMFLDLDDFKRINDSLGHETGDALLVKVSKIIQNQLREGDILGRLGGDEFLILLYEINENHLDTAICVADRIIQALTVPIVVHGWEVQTGVSIGIADAKTSEYQAETIIRNADIAMYHAKGSGRNTFAMFQQELQAESMRKMLIANALTKALLENEFSIAYQIKVGQNEQINGFEALIRWDSSFDGVISPAEFIPVAEHSGKITAIGRWVLRHVFEDLPTIVDICGSGAKMSINLSAHDVKDCQFIDFIKKQMTEQQVDPSLVEFEITESAYLDNFDDANIFFKEVRKLGFSIALDDFGTGYSSMSYLTRIDLDTLKIDQQFVRRMDDSTKDKLIIEAIIGLAHSLELNVCAEGVETFDQKNFLIRQGCQQLQGYYFSKPCALEDLAATVKKINQPPPGLVK